MPLPNTTFQVRTLKLEKVTGITSLGRIVSEHYKEWKDTHGDKQDVASRMLQSLRLDIMLLLNHPLTFHDIMVFMAQAQWYCLNVLAFLDYIIYVQPCIAYPTGPPLPIRSHWMGCFMQSTKICDDLFHTGVPVWLIQPCHTITSQTNIERHVKFMFPDEIVCSTYSEGGKPHHFDCLYHRPGGFSCHLHMQCSYTGSRGPSPQNSISQPSIPQVSSKVGKMPTQAQAKRAAQKKECTCPQPGK